MQSLVDTLIEHDPWQALGLPGLADRAARRTLTHVGLPVDDYEISLLACDDARIAQLNEQFRGKPSATNVLSWPSADLSADAAGDVPDLAEAEEELGDIAIAWETCMQEAKGLGRPVEEHVTHLIVHGVLHLLGYDHVRDEDAALMERLEIAILAEMGIADPYAPGADSQPGDGK